jgi:hypothetical protein
MTGPNISRQDKIEALSDAIRGSDAFKSFEKSLKNGLNLVANQKIPKMKAVIAASNDELSSPEFRSKINKGYNGYGEIEYYGILDKLGFIYYENQINEFNKGESLTELNEALDSLATQIAMNATQNGDLDDTKLYDIANQLNSIAKLTDKDQIESELSDIGLSEDQVSGLMGMQELVGDDINLISELAKFTPQSVEAIIATYNQNLAELSAERSLQSKKDLSKTDNPSPPNGKTSGDEGKGKKPPNNSIVFKLGVSDSNITNGSLRKVEKIQEYLIALNMYEDGPPETMGVYDQKTVDAVKKYQSEVLNISSPDGKIYFNKDYPQSGDTYPTLYTQGEKAIASLDNNPPEVGAEDEGLSDPDLGTEADAGDSPEGLDAESLTNPVDKEYLESVYRLSLLEAGIEKPMQSLQLTIAKTSAALKNSQSGLLGGVKTAMMGEEGQNLANNPDEYYQKVSLAFDQLIEEIPALLAERGDVENNPFEAIQEVFENIETQEDLVNLLQSLQGSAQDGGNQISDLLGQINSLNEAAENLGVEPFNFLQSFKLIDFSKASDKHGEILTSQLGEGAESVRNHNYETLTADNNREALDIFNKQKADSLLKAREERLRSLHEERQQGGFWGLISEILSVFTAFFQSAGQPFADTFSQIGERLKSMMGFETEEAQANPQATPEISEESAKAKVNALVTNSLKSASFFATQNALLPEFKKIQDEGAEVNSLADIYENYPEARTIIESDSFIDYQGKLSQESSQKIQKLFQDYMQENNCGYKGLLGELSNSNSDLKRGIQDIISQHQQSVNTYTKDNTLLALQEQNILPQSAENGMGYEPIEINPENIQYRGDVQAPSTQQAYASYSEDMLKELQSRRQQNGTPS